MSTVYAAFDSQQALSVAVAQLQTFGFSTSSIHYEGDELFREPPGSLQKDPGLLATVGSFFARLSHSGTPLPPGLYEETIRRGGAVLAVEAGTSIEEQTARELLRNAGAIDARKAGDRQEVPIVAGIVAAVPASPDRGTGDRPVAVGGLPLRNVAAEDTVRPEAFARLPGLALAVGHGGPMGAIASEADFMSFRSGTYEVRERVEVITLSKVVRVVEELAVNKSVTIYSETIDDLLRGSAVVLEPIAEHPRSGSAQPATVPPA